MKNIDIPDGKARMSVPASPEPSPQIDVWHGVGGTYVRGKDGVRRRVEIPTLDLAEPDSEIPDLQSDA